MVEAHALRPQDALMPLYRDLFRGYEGVYQPIDGYLYATHRLTDEWNVRNGIFEEIPGTHRHHLDLDRRNNKPTNITRMDAGAAEVLKYDRSVFRRFSETVTDFRGTRQYRNHKVAAIREIAGDHDVYCLTVPEAGNFALEAGVFVKNCGIIVNVTPLEPEWEGHVTLEFSNTTPLPAKIYANEGVAQMLFFESDEVCETSYKDRGGKYQGQRGVTLPKT
jgi:dCTP deaminase